MNIAAALSVGWILGDGVDNVAAQTVNFTRVGSIQGPVELVKVQGARAYVAAAGTLVVVDVSDPATPKRLGAYAFSNRIWGFRVVGSLVYVAADLLGLVILDMSNASAPTLRGSLKTPGQAKSVAVSGTMALVTDQVSGLDVIDVSNPAKPIHVGSAFLEGFATDVVTAGSFAYAADRPTGFYVFDLSKPGPLEVVGMLQTAAPTNTRGAQVEILDPSGQGAPLAVLVAGGLLQMFDVSNPAAPVKIAPYRTPGGALRVALKGRMAFVADGGEGLQVVDLATPSNPRIVGTYKTAAPANDVAVADSLVFVVVGNGEVQILRQTP